MSALHNTMRLNYKEYGRLFAIAGMEKLGEHCRPKCDRTTVYRRLIRFEDLGIFHWRQVDMQAKGRAENIYFPGPDPDEWKKRKEKRPVLQSGVARGVASGVARITHIPITHRSHYEIPLESLSKTSSDGEDIRWLDHKLNLRLGPPDWDKYDRPKRIDNRIDYHHDIECWLRATGCTDATELKRARNSARNAQYQKEREKRERQQWRRGYG